jgi:hypothetical protein
MPEEFSEISRKSVWGVVQDIAAIGDVLRKELPYDSLAGTWHNEDGTDNFTIGIVGRMGEKHHFLSIYTHYFEAPPEPKEINPPNCCAIGTTPNPCPERHSKSAEPPSGGWCITTKSGCRSRLPTSPSCLESTKSARALRRTLKVPRNIRTKQPLTPTPGV